MQNHRMLYTIAFVLACAFLTSCASTHTPSRWLPDPEQAASDTYGAWVEIKSRHGNIWGELVAVAEETVFVADSSLHAIASTDILAAQLLTYDASGLGWYVPLGTLSTLSNGWFLVFTAPMWIIGGTIAAISRSYDPIIDYPDKLLKQFVPFARYPQGLPPDLDRRAIRMKQRK